MRFVSPKSAASRAVPRRHLLNYLSAIMLAVSFVALVQCQPAWADASNDAFHAAHDVMPICAPGVPATTWQAHDSLVASTVIAGPDDLQYDKHFVGVGLTFDCASQLFMDHDPSWTSYFTGQSVTATAFPNTIDSAGGDGQHVSINFSGTDHVMWPHCFTGEAWARGFCPIADYPDPPVLDGGHAFGMVLFRLRTPGGTFSGPWTATSGRNGSPGFYLDHPLACLDTATSCTYSVTFIRSLLNQTIVNQDAQVILHFSIDTPTYTGYVAVPMLIKQSGGATAAPTPKPKPCIVPRVARKKLTRAKSLLASNGCATGKITRVHSRTVGKGRVISASFKPGTKHAAHAKVALKVSLGPRR